MGSQMPDSVANVKESIDWTNELHGQMILYRGLADAVWEVESSAYRRIRISEEVESESLLATTFRRYVDQLLNEAGLQGFRVRSEQLSIGGGQSKRSLNYIANICGIAGERGEAELDGEMKVADLCLHPLCTRFESKSQDAIAHVWKDEN